MGNVSSSSHLSSNKSPNLTRCVPSSLLNTGGFRITNENVACSRPLNVFNLASQSHWSNNLIRQPMIGREFIDNKKTCLNDCELCILLFQHRILWYHELSKYHLKLLSNDLPKIKFYLTQIFTQNHEDSFLSFIYSIHWYSLDP